MATWKCGQCHCTVGNQTIARIFDTASAAWFIMLPEVIFACVGDEATMADEAANAAMAFGCSVSAPDNFLLKATCWARMKLAAARSKASDTPAGGTGAGIIASDAE